MLAAVLGASLTNVDTLITTTNTSRYQLGSIMYDTQTNNVFIYMQGVASCLQYDLVTFNSATYVTTRSAAAAVGPCAIAQAAINATTSAGWFQVAGVSTINTGAATAATKGLYLHATAGSVSATGVAGDWITNMTSITSSASAVPVTVAFAYSFVVDDAYLT